MEDQCVKGFPRGGIQYRSCNITCLTMILHYYSIIDLTPEQLLELFWIFFCFFFHAISFLLEYYVAFFMSTMLY